MRKGPADLVHRVARRIAAVRAERGLTQEGLAARLEIATKNVQRLEAGGQNLTLRTIERIARVLDVAPDALITLPLDVQPSTTATSPLEILAAAGFPVRLASAGGRRPRSAIPVVDLRVAVGPLREGPRASDVVGWVELPRSPQPPKGTFAARISGRSMESRIPDGSICLFAPLAAPVREGLLALVELRTDPDCTLGDPYALKRIGTIEKLRGGRRLVTLESLNCNYAPVALVLTDRPGLRVVATFVRVLAPRVPA